MGKRARTERMVSITARATGGTKFTFTNKGWDRARLIVKGHYSWENLDTLHYFDKKELKKFYQGILKLLMMMDMEEAEDNEE